MKFRDIKKGNRAITRVRLPLVNRPSPFLRDQPELAAQRAQDAEQYGAQDEVMVGIRVLSGEDQALINELSTEWAKGRRARAFNEADPQYNLGVSVYTCAIACVDPDSNPADPEPFFGSRGDPESAAAELLSSPDIGRDGIIYLAEAQEVWQKLCSPQAKDMPPEKLHEAMAKIVSEDLEVSLRSFLELAPGTRWLLARSGVALSLSSLTPKSPSGATSQTSSLSSPDSGETAQ